MTGRSHGHVGRTALDGPSFGPGPLFANPSSHSQPVQSNLLRPSSHSCRVMAVPVTAPTAPAAPSGPAAPAAPVSAPAALYSSAPAPSPTTPRQGSGSPAGSVSAADCTMFDALGTSAADPIVVSSMDDTARSRKKEEAMSGPLMFRHPLSMATVVVNGTAFHIHADLLCRQSGYFQGCLRGGFAESQTQSVSIEDDDLTADDFGLWVDLLYRAHFQRDFVLRKEEVGGTLSTMQLLVLWKLSDRFINEHLRHIVCESLAHRLSLYSVEQWRKLYRTRPSSEIRARVSRLQEAFHFCEESGLPFSDDIVRACANCPPQVYNSSCSLFEKDFMALVSKCMLMRHADASLVGKDDHDGADSDSRPSYVVIASNGHGGVGAGAVNGRAAGGFGTL